MKNTVCNTILSIIDTKDSSFIEKKINTLEEQIQLNETEKKIIKDIKDSLFMQEPVSKEFISDKYSYYVDSDENFIPAILSKDAIDSAIIDIRVKQLKNDLTRQMLDLGSRVNHLTPQEIKESFLELYSNVLIEQKQAMPENEISSSTDPYSDFVEDKDGMSLIVPEVEASAGKAIKGTLVSILAFTGSFKSTYALNLAYDNARRGHNILYLSLESTGSELMHRLVLNHIVETADLKSQYIESNFLRDKKLRKDQIEYYNSKYNELVRDLNDHLILWDSTKINYQTHADMSTTLRLADKQFKEKTGRGLDGIVVDQLSLLKYTSGSNRGRKASYDGAVINDWVSYFREQALNFLDEGRQITVFMVAQTSRDAYKEASKKNNLGRYDASCSSDSHEIERSSSTMVTLYKTTSIANTLLVSVVKARNGYTTDNPVQVRAYGQYFHVGDLKHDHDYGLEGDEFNIEDHDIETGLDDILDIG